MSSAFFLANSSDQSSVNYRSISWSDNNDLSRPYLDLDIYHFNEGSTKKRPVIFMIHGGGWHTGDKSSFDRDYKPRFFKSLGCIYVSVNYRLSRNSNILNAINTYTSTLNKTTALNVIDYSSWSSSRVKHPTPIQDIANALTWVYNNIDKYGGDRSKIVVGGHSAGAYFALLACTNTTYLTSAGFPSPTTNIKGCIHLDGDVYNISDKVDLNEDDFTDESSNAILLLNAFGIPTSINNVDFATLTAQNNSWNSASPSLYANTSAIKNFLFCTRGDLARITRARTMSNALDNVTGITCTFGGYPGNATYTHEEIQKYIGHPDGIPPGKSLPTSFQISQGAFSTNINTVIQNYLSSISII